MLDFIGSVFKGVVSVIIVIAMIAVLVGGFRVMSNSLEFGLLVWLGGFISIFLFFGMVSIFVEINENIKVLISKTGNASTGNASTANTYESVPRVANLSKKKCSKCKKEVNEDNSKCPYCGNDTFE